MHPYTMQLCDNFLATFGHFLSSFCVFLKWDKLTQKRTNDCTSGKGKGDFVQMTTWYYLILRLKINIFLGKEVQCKEVQCVLYDLRNKDSPTAGNFTLQTLWFRNPSLK